MGSLSMVEANLPPGFRFHPRDDELICDYLINKIAGSRGGGSGDDQPHHQLPILIQVDLNKCEPWDIPEVACVGMNGRKERYFYCQRDRKYATGLRTNRATISGYWKATGKDREVIKKNCLVGMRKTLVFYQGRAPKGKKTDWVMHEFRLAENSSPNKDADWVLCRVFHKKKEDSSAINKQAMEISSGSSFTHYSQDDDDSINYCHSSSSLPPLVEQCFTFDQSQLLNLDQYQSSTSISQITQDQPQNELFMDSHNFHIPNTLSSQKYLTDLMFTQQYFNQ